MDHPASPPRAHLRGSQPRLAPLTTLDDPPASTRMERNSSGSSSSILSGPLSYNEEGSKPSADNSTSVSFAALPIIEASSTSTPAIQPGQDGLESSNDDSDFTAFTNSAAASRRGSAASAFSSSNNYNATLGPSWVQGNGKGLNPVTPARTPLVEGLEEGTDPLDWSNRFKCWAFFVYCLMVLSATYGSAAFAASAKTLEDHFGVSRLVAAAGTSLWVLGFAVGPLCFGPASEVAGRKPVYLVTFVLLILVQIGAALANSITLLLVMRFLGGIFGSAPLNNCASSISDMTRLRNRMRYNSLYRCATIGGATLGPLIGTFLNNVSWRVNLGVLPILSGVSLILYATTIPESHRLTIERRQIKARYQAAAALLDLEAAEKGAVPSKVEERMLAGPTTLQRYKVALKMPFIMLFKETLVQIVCAYTAMLYGLMYALLAASSLVWQDIRGRSEEYASLTYLALFGGIAVGVGVMGFWIQDQEFKKAYDADTCTPETRIGVSRWASFCVPVGLLLFGWTAPYDILVGPTDVHYVFPCLALAIFAFGLQSVFNSWLSYLTDAYGPRAASAMSAATFTRSLIGAAFPLFFRQLLIAITIQATFSIFAGLSLLLSLAGFWFHRNGAAIRARSHYAEGSE